MSTTVHAFRLYVAGDAPNSVRARANLAEIGRDVCGGHYTVDEIDVLKTPGRAMEDHILVTPTLVILSPGPPRRIVGNLSERATVVGILET